ncbi:hypothetical protein GQ53DRAFT_806968 [Thozetella sp. PMI_491]|nr:hypothetical protein GQ53DRAFT_806968 [Thozetella sp. PMI_491]
MKAAVALSIIHASGMLGGALAAPHLGQEIEIRADAASDAVAGALLGLNAVNKFNNFRNYVKKVCDISDKTVQLLDSISHPPVSQLQVLQAIPGIVAQLQALNTTLAQVPQMTASIPGLLSGVPPPSTGVTNPLDGIGNLISPALSSLLSKPGSLNLPGLSNLLNLPGLSSLTSGLPNIGNSLGGVTNSLGNTLNGLTTNLQSLLPLLQNLMGSSGGLNVNVGIGGSGSGVPSTGNSGPVTTILNLGNAVSSLQLISDLLQAVLNVLSKFSATISLGSMPANVVNATQLSPLLAGIVGALGNMNTNTSALTAFAPAIALSLGSNGASPVTLPGLS